MISGANLAARELTTLMMEISHEAYCATWMQDLEFDLWRTIQAGGGSYSYAEIDEARVAKLKDLSARCGGWVCFADMARGKSTPLADWQEKYDAWLSRR